MRFFISVNNETQNVKDRYDRTNLNAGTVIPVGDLLWNGSVTGRDSYKLIEFATQPKESPVIKRIEDAIHQRPIRQNLFFIESNSAHNISYFTAGITANLLEQGKKLLVVNFDQHYDHGTAKGELLCSNWGGFVKKHFLCDYMVIGEMSHEKKGSCIMYNAGKDGGITIEIKKISEIFAKYDAIYVTVDMDVLQNGDKMPKRTNWDQGILTKETLISYLNLLPNGKIISADITGFPPVKTAIPDEEKMQLTQYINDIEEIAQKLESKFNKEREIINAISYTL